MKSSLQVVRIYSVACFEQLHFVLDPAISEHVQLPFIVGYSAHGKITRLNATYSAPYVGTNFSRLVSLTAIVTIGHTQER